MSTHVLSLLVEDKPGLLTRVAGLFARRGFNIESLAVGHSEIEGLSRITVVVDVSTDALVIEVTGDSGKTTAFLKVLEPYGIKEIAQSGLLAIGRGGKSITERVFKN
jgi:acetolactate synthase-1/3 small subunit